MNAADPAGTSQTVISFAGGSVWNADFSGGTCVWYFPVVGNLDFESLFSDPKNASQRDFVPCLGERVYGADDDGRSAVPARARFAQPGAALRAGVCSLRNGDDLPAVGSLPACLAKSYGVQSAYTGKFKEHELGHSSGDVHQERVSGPQRGRFGVGHFRLHGRPVAFANFALPNGRLFDFGDLMKYGMTCFEHGQQGSSWESGTCIAHGR